MDSEKFSCRREKYVLVPFPFQADRYGFYKPFTPLEWPIHQFVRDGLFYASMMVILFYRRLGSLSKTMFWTCWILYFSATSLLPWNSILKYTFLGSMQYSGRLLFFYSPVVPFLSCCYK